MNAGTRPSTILDADETIDAYAAAADRFATTVLWSDLRAPVASCPGWSTYDLVVHLGNVHAWAATIVETGREAVEQNDEPRSSTKAKVVAAWYRGKAEDLYEVLRHSLPDDPVWNFVFGSGVAAFWSRRQLHETTIHQVDLDATRDRRTELDPEVCVDGISEVLTVMLQRMHQRGHPTDLDEPVALTAGDTGDTWVVWPRRPSDQVVPLQPVGSGNGPGDPAARGGAPSRPPRPRAQPGRGAGRGAVPVAVAAAGRPHRAADRRGPGAGAGVPAQPPDAVAHGRRGAGPAWARHPSSTGPDDHQARVTRAGWPGSS